MRLADGSALAAAVRWAAGLTAACLLAACTGSGAQHTVTPAQRFPRRVGFLPGPVIFAGGGGVVAFIGGASGGSRPEISVPPIPAANSSLAITMPLDAYQAVSAQQQEALAGASNLLAQRCMAARGFDDSIAASGLYTTVAALGEIETGGAGSPAWRRHRRLGSPGPRVPDRRAVVRRS
jgi:hypothetical protein